VVIGAVLLALMIGLVSCGEDRTTATTSTVAPTAAVTTEAATTTTGAPTSSTVAPTAEPMTAAVAVTVTEVIDGDTIGVTYNGLHESVRLLGIDASETGEAYNAEATAALKKLVGGKTARLEFDVVGRDQYDRLLAFVWVGSTTANAEMLRLGLATIYTVPPNVKYVEVLQAAQNEAQAARRGMWGAPAGSPLAIVSIHYNAEGNDNNNLNDEYVVFKALVAGTLAGYAVEDQTGHRYDFPDRVFKKGQTFTLHTGSGTDTPTDLYWNMSKSAVWNNDGDTVKVLDPQGHVVLNRDY
jgi:Micrococcal nuclease (thermonuclease) homologs